MEFIENISENRQQHPKYFIYSLGLGSFGWDFVIKRLFYKSSIETFAEESDFGDFILRMLQWIFTTLLNHLWEQYGTADVTIMEIVADNKTRYTGEHRGEG